MKMSAIDMRRWLIGLFAMSTLGAGVAAIIAVPTANSQPGRCSAAGLANTVSGVTGAAGGYLDSHPETNDALTRAGSQTPGEAEATLREYFGTHPQEFNDLRQIARPLTDLRAECNQSVSPGQISALLQAFAS
jgi:heme-binding protein